MLKPDLVVVTIPKMESEKTKTVFYVFAENECSTIKKESISKIEIDSFFCLQSESSEIVFPNFFPLILQ